MSGKSQSSLIILVMITILIIFVWIFSLFWNQSSQARTLASEKMTKLGKYVDIIKGMSRNYLIFSSQMATKKVAKTLTTYYVNGPYAPTITQIRATLSDEALKFLNKYVDNTHFKEAVFDYNIGRYACVDFPIEEEKLNSGEYDDKFYTGGYGSSVEIMEGSNKITSDNDIFETVTRDRFFLLYRKFVDWSKTLHPEESEKQLITRVAGCLTNACGCYYKDWNCQEGPKDYKECSQFYSCLRDLLDKEKNRLVTVMADPYIECSVEIICDNMEVVLIDNPDYRDYAVWDKSSRCININGPDRVDNVCSEGLSLSPQEKSDSKNYYVISFQQDPVFTFCEPRIAFKATYSCVDTKYELSVPPTERTLEFNVDVTVFVRRYCSKPSP